MSSYIYKSLSVLLFVLMSVCVKAVNENLPLSQIVFFRNFFAIFPIIFFIFWNRISFSYSKVFHLHFFRGFFGLMAMSLFFYSLRTVPLAEVKTLSFASVLFISILSVVFLKEKIGIRRIIAIIFGFVGIIIILNPTEAIFSNQSLVPVIASLFLSFAVICLKKILVEDNHFITIFYFTTFCTVTSLAFFNSTWIFPSSITMIYLVLSGILGFAAQFCLTKSFQGAEASVLAPFDFMSIVYGYIIGFIFFHELLSFRASLGSIIVVVSVAYIFRREYLLKKEISINFNKQY